MLKLVLFYSEGSPNDNAINMIRQKRMMEDKYKNEFDEIIFYTPKILRDIGYAKYCDEYSDAGNIYVNKEQRFIGFSKWKPLILKLELEKANKDDIIVYHDIDCIKYPNYLLLTDAKNTIKQILNLCNYDFFFPQEKGRELKQFCKNTVMEELGTNSEFNKNFHQLCVNFIILTNTSTTLELLDEWLKCCENDRWLNGVSYIPEKEYFCHHCPEQGILNNIIANWIKEGKNNISKKYPSVYLKRRIINDFNLVEDFSYLKYLDK